MEKTGTDYKVNQKLEKIHLSADCNINLAPLNWYFLVEKMENYHQVGVPKLPEQSHPHSWQHFQESGETLSPVEDGFEEQNSSCIPLWEADWANLFKRKTQTTEKQQKIKTNNLVGFKNKDVTKICERMANGSSTLASL